MMTRLLAAIVGLSVLLPAMIFGGPVAVAIIVPLVLFVCVTEYASMAFPDDRHAATAWLTLAVGGAHAAIVYAPASQQLAWVALVLIATMLLVLFRTGPLPAAADRLARYALGIGWLSLLSTLVLLRQDAAHGLALVFTVLVVSWCGDTGGYFGGRFFGRTKLYEKVSPKKTVEGLIGGVLGATVGVAVQKVWFFDALPWSHALVLAPLLCLAGVAGDLVESLLKRSFDVKDSGWIMPGHGGLLDRIDSVLFVAPLLYGYAVLVR